MPRATIGLSVGRYESIVAVVDGAGENARIAFCRAIRRQTQQTIPAAITELLKSIPAEFRSCTISMALSPALIACSDRFESALRSQRQIDEIKGSLAEARCAGEVAEDLAVDALQCIRTDAGSVIEIIAVSLSLLKDVRNAIFTALPNAHLVLVTSMPAAISQAVRLKEGQSEETVSLAGEQVVLSRMSDGVQQWRSFPIQLTDQVLGSKFTFTGIGAIESYVAPAVAAALCDVEQTANALRDADGIGITTSQRLRGQAVRLFGAAAVLLFAIGLMFHRQAQELQQEITDARDAERKAWTQYLPKERFQPGKLNQRLKERLAEDSKARDANSTPSALSLWAEMAAVLPNADSMGMTLDTLQLGQEEARMQARVNAPANDPLQHATQLEQALNRSEQLAARGEFENKGSEVLVRMRVDYKPTPKTGAPAAP
jgi:hypothetical protein